ncbi:transmembrane protein 138-like [Apostichopus japonicus]
MLQVAQYRGVLYLQYLLLVLDLFINAFVDLLRFSNVIQLVLFIVQDVCLIFATIVVFLMFFNTYVFQAGLVGYLVKKFRFTVLILFVYFAMCISLHIWTMTLRWDKPDTTYIWNRGYIALYVLQRVGAVLYYYYYKRTALRLGDPRFYKDSDWLRQQFEKVR